MYMIIHQWILYKWGSLVRLAKKDCKLQTVRELFCVICDENTIDACTYLDCELVCRCR